MRKRKSNRLSIILAVSWLFTAYGSYAPARSEAQTVEVFKYDGSIQCEKDSGMSLSAMEGTLTSEGIEVISRRRAHDGLLRAAMCGTGTGRINVYEIKRSQLQVAESLEFKILSKLPR